MKRLCILHPFLLALFSPCALYLHNIEGVSLPDLLPALLFAALVAALSLCFGRLLLRSWQQAALLASLLVVLFFGYGHVYQLIVGHIYGKQVVVGAALLLVCGLLAGAGLAGIRRTRRSLDIVTVLLGTLSLGLIAVPVFGICRYEIAALPAPREAVEGSASGEADSGVSSVVPRRDIYYLIFDRYPSPGTLLDTYGYDNSAFVDFLRSRGFYVPDRSLTNYARTDMSLASSLNWQYLDSLGVVPGSLGLQRTLRALIQDNRTVRFLHHEGYRYLHFGSQWTLTARNANADRNVNRLLLSEFSMVFYKTTVLYPIGAALGFDKQKEQWRRERYKFEELRKVAQDSAATFVFAHFLLPHEPYVFDSSGAFVNRFRQIRRGTRAGFAGQVAYVNAELRQLIPLLQDCSDVPPVIIIQADEGPHPPENFTHTDSMTTLRARFRILSAYYLPAVDTVGISSSITPVNTFRLVLNSYFGTDYGLLPDESFLDEGGRLRNVSEIVRYR